MATFDHDVNLQLYHVCLWIGKAQDELQGALDNGTIDSTIEQRATIKRLCEELIAFIDEIDEQKGTSK